MLKPELKGPGAFRIGNRVYYTAKLETHAYDEAIPTHDSGDARLVAARWKTLDVKEGYSENY